MTLINEIDQSKYFKGTQKCFAMLPSLLLLMIMMMMVERHNIHHVLAFRASLSYINAFVNSGGC